MIKQSNLIVFFLFLFLFSLCILFNSCSKKIFSENKNDVYIDITTKKVNENHFFRYEVVNNSNKKIFFIMEPNYDRIEEINDSSFFFSFFPQFVLIGNGGGLRLMGITAQNQFQTDDINMTEDDKKKHYEKISEHYQFYKNAKKNYIIIGSGEKQTFYAKFNKRIITNQKYFKGIEYMVKDNEKYKVFLEFNTNEINLDDLGSRDKQIIDSLKNTGYKYFKGRIQSNIVNLKLN